MPHALDPDIKDSLIQSMGASKTLDLEMLIQEHKPDCLCFTEHWLHSHEIGMVALDGYSLVSSYC